MAWRSNKHDWQCLISLVLITNTLLSKKRIVCGWEAGEDQVIVFFLLHCSKLLKHIKVVIALTFMFYLNYNNRDAHSSL